MQSATDPLYQSNPLEVVDGIPVFSEMDTYTANYHQIAADHVTQLGRVNKDFWLDEDSWSVMERSTVELAMKYIQAHYQKKKIRLLDVGVGMGRLLSKIQAGIADRQADVYGMDIAMPYLEIARNKGLDVCFAKIEDMPYKPESFELITCTDVLEHVIDLNLCLSKILNVLKPGGYLIVRVPYREDLSPYLEPDYPYPMAHLRNFDKPSLVLLFTRVFAMRVLEFTPGVFLPSYNLLKFHIPGRRVKTLIQQIRFSIKKRSPRLHTQLVNKMYQPSEINLVVQKPGGKVF